MQQDRDEGSIYAARRGMRACNNTNMRNPPTSLLWGFPAFILHLFPYFLVLPSLHPSTFNGNVFTPFTYKLDAESRELRDLESRGLDVATRA